MPVVNVPIRQAVKGTTMTVNVTGLRTWCWRVAFGVWLMRVAAWVIGCGFEVEC